MLDFAATPQAILGQIREVGCEWIGVQCKEVEVQGWELMTNQDAIKLPIYNSALGKLNAFQTYILTMENQEHGPLNTE